MLIHWGPLTGWGPLGVALTLTIVCYPTGYLLILPGSREYAFNDLFLFFRYLYLDHIDSSGQVVITKKNLRVGDLDGRIYDKLCQKLNLPIVNKNWKALGGLMKYSNDDLKIFEQKDDPADALLASWGTKSENDVNRLVELLKEMERDDLVKLL